MSAEALRGQRLVAYLRAHRETLLTRWERRVRADAEVEPARTLSEPQLRDHLPGLLDALITCVENHCETGGKPVVRGRALGHSAPAIGHAHHRQRQGYTLAQALRELSWFRTVLIELCGERDGIDREHAVLIHAALDESMTTVAVEMERYAVDSRDQVLRVVSHDLRGPLSAVVMAAARLMSAEGLDALVRKRVDVIDRAAQRMTRLVNDLTDLGSIDAGTLRLDLQRVDPRALLDEAVESSGANDGDLGITIDVQVAELPMIRCDPGRFLQAIGNVLSNACKVVPPRTGRIVVSGFVRDEQVVIAIADNGPGIDVNELPRLFERFWRSPRASYDGTGLGLAIAKAIVEAHGGDIWAESSPAGATVSLALPMQLQRAPSNTSSS